jgi:hypothetical protein
MKVYSESTATARSTDAVPGVASQEAEVLWTTSGLHALLACASIVTVGCAETTAFVPPSCTAPVVQEMAVYAAAVSPYVASPTTSLQRYSYWETSVSAVATSLRGIAGRHVASRWERRRVAW